MDELDVVSEVGLVVFGKEDMLEVFTVCFTTTDRSRKIADEESSESSSLATERSMM